MEMLINVKELNEVCALPDRKFSTETHFNLANREMIHEVFRYQKFHDDFADNIRYEYSTNSFLGTFKPSYDEFLKTVVKTLNLKTNRGFNDDEALTKKLLERVDLLSGLQDRKELRGEFPELNTMLTEAQEYWDEIEQEKANPIYKEDYEEERHYFFSCGLRAEGRRKGFDGFIPAQTEIYKRFITRREDYKKLAEKYSYDKFIQDNYDIDKLAMYMADKYLSICEQSPDSRKILERYNKILEKYINEPRFDKNTSIKVNGKYINYDNIMERYNILQERIKNIYAKVNWVIVPEGELDRYVRRGLGSTRSFIITDEEIERIKKVRQDKIDIRNKNKPKLLLTVYGECGLNGYIGDIYENGEVLLDTISTLDNAIYRIPARYFEMVSGLDKQKLMKHPAVHRLYHAGNWQKRVQKIIDQEGTQEEQEQAKMLVKRLIEENEKNIK